MRRKNKNFKKLIGYSMTMGGIGLIGGKLPALAAAPVQAISTAGSPFVAPMTSATGAGMAMGALKDLKPKRRRRRKR